MPVLFVALLGAACSGPARIPRATLPSAPAALARCQVAASQSSPLVTEWPASEKANLEARVREGGVAVAYSGCAMRILPECTVAGTYSWHRTTPARDRIHISNVDDLYAKLPLGAASLEGALERSGELTMETTVSGQLRLAGVTPHDVPTGGGCAEATHLVTGLAVGAFNLSSSGKLTGSASAEVVGVGSGVSTTSEKSLVREAGDPARCHESTYDYAAPDCSSPIQVFLTKIPGRVAGNGPVGTVKVSFYSATGDSSWSVRSGRRTLCKTPCTMWVDPSKRFSMKLKRSLARDDKVTVPSLSKHALSGPLQVHARPTSKNKLAAGTTLTTFSGAAVVTGIVLSALDCPGDDRGRMCTGGGISLVAGVIGLVPSIWLIRRSLARATVTSGAGDARPCASRSEPRPSAPSVVVGPGFVAGSF